MTPGGNRIGDFDFSTALEIIPHPSTARPTERRSGGRSGLDWPSMCPHIDSRKHARFIAREVP